MRPPSEVRCSATRLTWPRAESRWCRLATNWSSLVLRRPGPRQAYAACAAASSARVTAAMAESAQSPLVTLGPANVIWYRPKAAMSRVAPSQARRWRHIANPVRAAMRARMNGNGIVGIDAYGVPPTSRRSPRLGARPRPLRPAGVWRGRLSRQELAGMRAEQLVHVLHAAPLRDEHEQRLAVLAAEHARKAKLVELDPLQDLAALADAHAAWHAIREGRRPDGALRVHADAITTLAELGPDAPVRQAAIRGDIEGREPGLERLGNDQRLVVGRDDHPVGEVDVIGHLAD